ncbi:hypothetical protein LJC17_02200 [Acholeplasma sp. OttesenSCG-928-E16]|nr:hypothetical protein [Acholeplasma sp. OttesenSCG-928-E16]
MDKTIKEKVSKLYNRDVKESYEILLELETFSDSSDILYRYIDEFIAMLKSDSYLMRVRGFRLVCRQSKWDNDNLINERIDEILSALDDDKPTALRQKLQSLKFVILEKKELFKKIEAKALSIDLSKFKDSMKSLLEKDIKNLLSY